MYTPMRFDTYVHIISLHSSSMLWLRQTLELEEYEYLENRRGIVRGTSGLRVRMTTPTQFSSTGLAS